MPSPVGCGKINATQLLRVYSVSIASHANKTVSHTARSNMTMAIFLQYGTYGWVNTMASLPNYNDVSGQPNATLGKV